MAYAVASWLILQVADIAFAVLRLPEGGLTLVFVLLAVGFPLALIASWFLELTPEGLRLEKQVDRSLPRSRRDARRIDFVIIGILVAAVLVLTVDRLTNLSERSATISSSTEKSLAILPFVNVSGDNETDPFAAGIHDDILTHVSRIGELKVISRTSVLRYRGTTKAMPEIARELGVTAVMEGTVQREGTRLRINVQLIDAVADRHLWGQSFDRELTTRDVLAIQSEIAGAVALAMRATLSPGERVALARLPTESLEAYRAYLLGRQRMVQRSRTALLEAAGYFQKAIDIDPDYALPYVGLADAHMLLGAEGETLLEELVATVEPALDQALILNDKLAEAYASLGLLREKTGRLAEAEIAYRRAIQLDPNYPAAHHWYGNMQLGVMARPEAAIAPLERALELDPLSPVINLTLGEAYDGVGRFAEAMELFQTTVEIEPRYPSGHVVVAHMHRFVYGRLDLALEWYRKGVDIDSSRARDVSSVGLTYLELGSDAEAEKWIRQALALGPEKYLAPNEALTLLHRYRGREQEALTAARRLLSMSPGNHLGLATLVSFGQYREAVDLDPEKQSRCQEPSRVNRGNLRRALQLSLALERTDQPDCARKLVLAALDVLNTMPRLGMRGFGFADVELYARLGETRKALAALRSAIDQGARGNWLRLKLSPHIERLRDDPEFRSMMEEVEADLSIQRQQVEQNRPRA
ncbi:MAG: tetratricopeptide repeat protein [Xanthomonadales bacterium]|nr:tetratricopeptide repeat protein [Xanthomonadales bacterium]